jgi:hypothetical protein
MSDGEDEDIGRIKDVVIEQIREAMYPDPSELTPKRCALKGIGFNPPAGLAERVDESENHVSAKPGIPTDRALAVFERQAVKADDCSGHGLLNLILDLRPRNRIGGATAKVGQTALQFGG